MNCPHWGHRYSPSVKARSRPISCSVAHWNTFFPLRLQTRPSSYGTTSPVPLQLGQGIRFWNRLASKRILHCPQYIGKAQCFVKFSIPPPRNNFFSNPHLHSTLMIAPITSPAANGRLNCWHGQHQRSEKCSTDCRYASNIQDSCICYRLKSTLFGKICHPIITGGTPGFSCKNPHPP